jgi:endo-1,4-beta-xylanase
MNQINRRNFIKRAAIGTVAVAASPYIGWSSVYAKTDKDIVFKPYPHEWMPEINFAYLADENVDSFKFPLEINNGAIVIPKEIGNKRFSLNLRWFVEGFGFVVLSADNGGELYSLGEPPSTSNLNFEFAKSRIIRNREIKKRYENRTKFSFEVESYINLAEEFFKSASKQINNPEKCGELSNKSLYYSLWGGEKIEIEHAKNEIAKLNRHDNVYFGCETRQYIWAKSEDMMKNFTEIFNYATITHYVWDTWYELFEPHEGYYNWGIKDDIAHQLEENNITIEGRPLFWFHPSVTPDWLKNKSFDDLKKYVVKHTKDLVSHYGDKVLHWEVVNEYHDWANIHDHSPEQITEIVRLACDTTKEVNPNVVRIINNCCPWAEYAANGRRAGSKEPAKRSLRSPRKFLQDLQEAEVDYDILGIQIYFPDRDLSDIMRLIERLEKFGKPIYITEMGASSGYSEESIKTDDMKILDEPYRWHRRWDEELQADWLEQVYTLYYSRPNIKCINWYDFSDFRPFIKNGGLVREDSSPKKSFYRLHELLKSWNRLPET